MLIVIECFCVVSTTITIHVLLFAGNIFNVWSTILLANKRCEYCRPLSVYLTTIVSFMLDLFEFSDVC